MHLLPDMAEGATIFVPKQLEEIRSGKNTVYVMGEVAKPGAFDSKPGAGFIDILANSAADPLCRYAPDPADQGQWRGQSGGSAAFHEGKGGKLPNVDAGDAIFVPEKTDTKEPSWLKIAPDRAVKLMGAVTRPGRFEWSDEMSLLDLLAQAGGPTHKADLARIQIRLGETDKGKPVLFDLTAYLNGQVTTLPRLRAGAVIMVPDLPSSPGRYEGPMGAAGTEASIYIMGQSAPPDAMPSTAR